MSEEIQGIESFTKNQVRALIRCLGLGAMLMDWDKLDYEVGRGILEGESRCLWTTDGHRITITVCRDSGFIAGQSNEPDPLYTELRNALVSNPV